MHVETYFLNMAILDFFFQNMDKNQKHLGIMLYFGNMLEIVVSI
jgi:hypothetical protein